MNSTRWTLADVLLAALVLLSALSHALVPLRADQDFWWHLKTGQVIVEGGYTLPENDIFAFTSQHFEWHNHEYLTQILMYHVYRLGEALRTGAGVPAVIAAKAAAIALAFLLLFGLLRRRTKHAAAAALVTIVAINVSRYTMYPRPPVVTYLLLAVFLIVTYCYVFGNLRKWWPALLPLLIVPWVNMHGGFVLGMIVLGGFGAGECLEGAWLYFRRRDDREKWIAPLRRGGWLFATLFGCVLFSLANPYGFELYGIFERVMGDPLLVSLIPELQAPDFYHTRTFLAMVGFLIAGGMALAACKKRRPHIGEIMIVAFIMWQAFKHVRHHPIFAILSAPLCAWLLVNLLPERKSVTAEDGDKEEHATKDSPNPVWHVPLSALAFVLAIYFFAFQDVAWNFNNERGPNFSMTYMARNGRLLSGRGTEPRAYPEETVRFILSHPFRGRMFNVINDAGYFIWRMSPEPHKVFTDDRFDIFGGRFLLDEMIIKLAREPQTVEGEVQIVGWHGVEAWREQVPHAPPPVEPLNGAVRIKGWRERLDDWSINFVAIGEPNRFDPHDEGFPLIGRLTESEKWTLVYYPGGGVAQGHLIFVRDVPENRSLIEACRSTIRARDGGWFPQRRLRNWTE